MTDQLRPRVFVDERWRGAHGIGRYAAEILPRLTFEWFPLGLTGTASSALDAYRQLPVDARRTLIYSPGYGALRRAATQVLTIHDLIHLRTPWPERAKFLAYYNGPVRSVVRRAGVVITDSEASRREISEWVRDDSVRIVNAGVGCSAVFRPEGPIEVTAEPYALYVGNMRPHKNLDVVMRALAGLPAARLKAIIPRDEAEEARRQFASRGVDDRIDLIHSPDDDRLAALYRGAAVTVMPSLMEGFGLPPLESVMCGTPVIYWRGCEAVAETVGELGISIADAHHPAEWRSAMEFALSSPWRVVPPDASVHDWDRTASIISRTVEQFRDGES